MDRLASTAKRHDVKSAGRLRTERLKEGDVASRRLRETRRATWEGRVEYPM